MDKTHQDEPGLHWLPVKWSYLIILIKTFSEGKVSHLVAILGFPPFLKNLWEWKASKVVQMGQRWRCLGPAVAGVQGSWVIGPSPCPPDIIATTAGSTDKSFYFSCSLEQTRISNNSDQDSFHSWGFSPSCWIQLCFEITAERGARGARAGSVRCGSLFLSGWNNCKLAEERTVVVLVGACVYVCVKVCLYFLSSRHTCQMLL